MKEMIDILIKGGLVFDGTGAEPFEADIGIYRDRIAFVKRKLERSFKFSGIKTIIDARGMAVAPGFIDTHAHSDFTLIADGRAEGKIFQGITTEINGNCGLSAAPLLGEAAEQRETDLSELGIRERWTGLKEYFNILERKGIAINFATLAGHGNIRASVIGYEDKKPDSNELERMKYLLKESLSCGAIGLSTGLAYAPGVYSDTEEIIGLCEVLSDYSGESPLIYSSHMRSEGENLIESVRETIKIGRMTGVGVHISHIKTSGHKNWFKIGDVISEIENARSHGIKVTCDRYPYTASSTDLDVILPAWVYEGGIEEEMKRLIDPEKRKRIKREILKEYPEQNMWENSRIATISSDKNKWMEGKSIAEISGQKHSEPIDIVIDILIEERLRVSAIFSSMNEENLRRFLSLEYLMIGTDSAARCMSGPTHTGKPHPRGFGSFPRFLGRYIRDAKLMSYSEAIHRITKLPAKTFNLNRRGILKKGMFADVVIFDFERLNDKATFDEPFLKPEGINYVIINGFPALREGVLTGLKGGRILKHVRRRDH